MDLRLGAENDLAIGRGMCNGECDWGKIKYYGQFIQHNGFRLHFYVFICSECAFCSVSRSCVFDLLTFIPPECIPQNNYFVAYMKIYQNTHLLQLVMRFFHIYQEWLHVYSTFYCQPNVFSFRKNTRPNRFTFARRRNSVWLEWQFPLSTDKITLNVDALFFFCFFQSFAQRSHILYAERNIINLCQKKNNFTHSMKRNFYNTKLIAYYFQAGFFFLRSWLLIIFKQTLENDTQ